MSFFTFEKLAPVKTLYNTSHTTSTKYFCQHFYGLNAAWAVTVEMLSKNYFTLVQSTSVVKTSHHCYIKLHERSCEVIEKLDLGWPCHCRVLESSTQHSKLSRGSEEFCLVYDEVMNGLARQQEEAKKDEMHQRFFELATRANMPALEAQWEAVGIVDALTHLWDNFLASHKIKIS